MVSGKMGIGLAGVAIGAVLLVAVRYLDSGSPPRKAALMPRSFPATGTALYFRNDPAALYIAPLTIYAGPANTVVKIETWDIGDPLMETFIEAGDAVRLNLPAGRYRIKAATGSDWFGPSALFGPNTQMVASRTPLAFERSDAVVAGAVIRLSGNRAGTIPMTHVSAAGF